MKRSIPGPLVSDLGSLGEVKHPRDPEHLARQLVSPRRESGQRIVFVHEGGLDCLPVLAVPLEGFLRQAYLP